MNKFQTLKRQFEMAAQKFQGMIYFMNYYIVPKAVQIKEPERPAKKSYSILNQINSQFNIKPKYQPKYEEIIEQWDCDADKRDYAEHHYLFRHLNWDKKEALEQLKGLARTGIGFLVDEKKDGNNLLINTAFSEIGALLLTGEYLQAWIKSVCIIENIPKVDYLGQHFAKKGERYQLAIDDVFLQSVFACDTLLEQIKTKQITKNKNTCKHSTNYDWVNWYGTEYTFNGSQAKIIKLLWESQEPVNEKTIAQHINTVSDNYRLIDSFRIHGKYHPAWKTMIKNLGHGTYNLNKP